MISSIASVSSRPGASIRRRRGSASAHIRACTADDRSLRCTQWPPVEAAHVHELHIRGRESIQSTKATPQHEQANAVVLEPWHVALLGCFPHGSRRPPHSKTRGRVIIGLTPNGPGAFNHALCARQASAIVQRIADTLGSLGAPPLPSARQHANTAAMQLRRYGVRGFQQEQRQQPASSSARRLRAAWPRVRVSAVEGNGDSGAAKVCLLLLLGRARAQPDGGANASLC